MIRIAVTGAAGFVGRHLCAAGALAGHAMQPLGRANLASRVLEREVEGADVVVHLAARVPGGGGEPRTPEGAFAADNVDLTLRVAGACACARVRRLVFVSSAGVLGTVSPPEGFTDASIPAPHDAYARSKLAAEDLLMERCADRLEVVVVRPPLVYGPGAAGRFARILRPVLAGWPLPLGSVDALRSMVSVRNLIDLLLAAAVGRDVHRLRMLVADAEAIGAADLVREIAHAAGRRARLLRVPPVLLRSVLGVVGHGRDYASLWSPCVLRGSLASERLGWTPPYRLTDEIRWTVTGSFPGGIRPWLH